MDEALEAIILGGANENDIEYVVLHNILGVENEANDPHIDFDLNAMSDENIKINFRFERQDLYRLLQALRIPHIIQTQTRNSVIGKFIYVFV